MARTNDDRSFARIEQAVIILSIPQTSVCKPSVPQTSGFDQWWEDKKRWYEMTGRIERPIISPIPLSVEQQYKQDLMREGKMEHIPGLRELDKEIEQLAALEEDW